MTHYGKIIGAMIGVFFGPFGLLFGLLAGHFYDLHIAQFRGQGNVFKAFNLARAQQAFFRTTFMVMGHIAKVDGTVSRSEIQRAEQIMLQLGLNQRMRQQAIHYFNYGKQPTFNLQRSLTELMSACRSHRNLLSMFIEIQFQIAYADQKISKDKAQILILICNRLGFTVQDYQDFNRRYQARQSYRQRPAQRDPRSGLDQAYDILGITKNASDADVKRAYRRQMAKHHPDKLVAKGLPEEMMKIATEKTQAIKAAYDQIRKVRGIR